MATPYYNSYIPPRDPDDSTVLPRSSESLNRQNDATGMVVPPNIRAFMPSQTESNRQSVAASSRPMVQVPPPAIGQGGFASQQVQNQAFLPQQGMGSEVFVPGRGPMNEMQLRKMGAPDSSKVTERAKWLKEQQFQAQQAEALKAQKEQRLADIAALQKREDTKARAEIEAAKEAGQAKVAAMGVRNEMEDKRIASREKIATEANKIRWADVNQKAAHEDAALKLTEHISDEKIKNDMAIAVLNTDFKKQAQVDELKAMADMKEKEFKAKGDLQGQAEAATFKRSIVNQQLETIQKEAEKTNTPEAWQQAKGEQAKIMRQHADELEGKKSEAQAAVQPAEQKPISPENLQKARTIVTQYPKKEAAKLWGTGVWDDTKYQHWVEADEAVKQHEKQIRGKVAEQYKPKE